MLQVQGEASHILASTGPLPSHYAKGKSFKSISKLFVSLSRELTDDYSDKKKKKSYKCKQFKIAFRKSIRTFRTNIVPPH